MHGRGTVLTAALVVAAAVGGCAQPVDLKQSIEMVDAAGGWHDAGVVSGRNKIVPTVTFRLKKKAAADINRVSINALFRPVDGGESELNNDVFVQRVDFESEQTAP